MLRITLFKKNVGGMDQYFGQPAIKPGFQTQPGNRFSAIDRELRIYWRGAGHCSNVRSNYTRGAECEEPNVFLRVTS